MYLITVVCTCSRSFLMSSCNSSSSLKNFNGINSKNDAVKIIAWMQFAFLEKIIFLKTYANHIFE